jgi:pilus assembly protein CpaB
MSGYFSAYRKPENNYIITAALYASVFLFVLTLFAMILVTNSADSNASQASSTVVVETSAAHESIELLMPIQTIEAGQQLNSSMFRKALYPKISASIMHVKDFEQIKGQYAKSMIVANQPLHLEYLSSIKPTNIITSMIPDGYRAVTIKVDERTGIEGWARGGARVDVTWLSTLRGKKAITVIVQNAKVISAAKQTVSQSQQGQATPTEITLMVSDQDATKIILAQQAGTVSLALRGDRETGRPTTSNTITIDDLMGLTRDEHKPIPENIVRIKDKNGQFAEFIWINNKLMPRENLPPE